MSQTVEMHFCDLCGLSIPDRDLQEGLARQIGEKRVGACCLAKIGAGQVAGAASAPGTAKPDTRTDASPSGSTFLVAVVVLFGAILGSAWLVDARSEERQLGERKRYEAALDSKVEELDRRMGGIREDLGGVVQQASAGLRSDLTTTKSELQKQLAALESKEGPGLELEKFRGTMSRLITTLGGLTARQDLLEQGLRGLTERVEQGMTQLRSGLTDLQRMARAGALASGPEGEGGAVPATKKMEALPEALGRRVDQLGSSDSGRRWEAVDELVRSGDKRVVPYLVPVLKDADPYVRKLCAEGFGKLGDPSVAMSLVDSLEDEAAIVRMAAYRSLVKLSGKSFPFDPDASEARRKKAVQKWRDWAKSATG